MLSPTATVVVPPTATSTPAPVYLPIVFRADCTPDQQRIDVALATDCRNPDNTPVLILLTDGSPTHP